jgi:cell division cycle 14
VSITKSNSSIYPNLPRYETFEQVNFGDFNWVTPSFIALASPQDSIGKPIPKSDPKYATIPRTPEDIAKCEDLSTPFKNVLTYFTQRNVGLIVRLNDPLYSPTFFTANGIEHLDMIFDDGTCPTLKMVKQFIRLAHHMITVKNKAIAVHCKAGLGRTGCLIGAYLIYRHGFSANEVIAYMRFMRPGMVVGPQQHWLHLNQNAFREWWFEDQMKEKLAALQPATPPRNGLRSLKANGGLNTPPHGTKRPALEEIHSNDQSPVTAAQNNAPTNDDAFLPAPTPGQPRKTSKSYGRSTKRTVSAAGGLENEPFEIMPDAEIVSVERHIPANKETGEASEDELQVHMLLRRASRSPAALAREKRRAISCTTPGGGVRKLSGRVGSIGTAREAVKAK